MDKFVNDAIFPLSPPVLGGTDSSPPITKNTKKVTTTKKYKCVPEAPHQTLNVIALQQ